MKGLLAVSLMLFSALSIADEQRVEQCDMNILKIENGELAQAGHAMGLAILTSDSTQFYAVVGDRIINSPILMDHKGQKAGQKAGAAFFMRDGSFGVMYDDFGYVFDNCKKVA